MPSEGSGENTAAAARVSSAGRDSGACATHASTARSARLFLCGRCRAQVLLCSHCDRGQHYCGRECSRLARQERRREAAQRYQRSWRGRLAHAERSRRWRERHAAARDGGQPCDPQIVTHQGCAMPEAAAPLASCASTCAFTAAALPCTPPTASPWQCRRCRHALLPLVRQGFLRRERSRDDPP